MATTSKTTFTTSVEGTANGYEATYNDEGVMMSSQFMSMDFCPGGARITQNPGGSPYIEECHAFANNEVYQGRGFDSNIARFFCIPKSRGRKKLEGIYVNDIQGGSHAGHWMNDILGLSDTKLGNDGYDLVPPAQELLSNIKFEYSTDDSCNGAGKYQEYAFIPLNMSHSASGDIGKPNLDLVGPTSDWNNIKWKNQSYGAFGSGNFAEKGMGMHLDGISFYEYRKMTDKDGSDRGTGYFWNDVWPWQDGVISGEADEMSFKELLDRKWKSSSYKNKFPEGNYYTKAKLYEGQTPKTESAYYTHYMDNPEYFRHLENEGKSWLQDHYKTFDTAGYHGWARGKSAGATNKNIYPVNMIRSLVGWELLFGKDTQPRRGDEITSGTFASGMAYTGFKRTFDQTNVSMVKVEYVLSEAMQENTSPDGAGRYSGIGSIIEDCPIVERDGKFYLQTKNVLWWKHYFPWYYTSSTTPGDVFPGLSNLPSDNNFFINVNIYANADWKLCNSCDSQFGEDVDEINNPVINKLTFARGSSVQGFSSNSKVNETSAVNFENSNVKETVVQESDDINNLGLSGLQSEAFDKFVETFKSELVDGGKYKNTYKTDNPRDYYTNDNKKIKLGYYWLEESDRDEYAYSMYDVTATTHDHNGTLLTNEEVVKLLQLKKPNRNKCELETELSFQMMQKGWSEYYLDITSNSNPYSKLNVSFELESDITENLEYQIHIDSIILETGVISNKTWNLEVDVSDFNKIEKVAIFVYSGQEVMNTNSIIYTPVYANRIDVESLCVTEDTKNQQTTYKIHLNYFATLDRNMDLVINSAVQNANKKWKRIKLEKGFGSYTENISVSGNPSDFKMWLVESQNEVTPENLIFNEVNITSCDLVISPRTFDFNYQFNNNKFKVLNEEFDLDEENDVKIYYNNFRILSDDKVVIKAKIKEENSELVDKTINNFNSTSSQLYSDINIEYSTDTYDLRLMLDSSEKVVDNRLLRLFRNSSEKKILFGNNPREYNLQFKENEYDKLSNWYESFEDGDKTEYTFESDIKITPSIPMPNFDQRNYILMGRTTPLHLGIYNNSNLIIEDNTEESTEETSDTQQLSTTLETENVDSVLKEFVYKYNKTPDSHVVALIAEQFSNAIFQQHTINEGAWLSSTDTIFFWLDAVGGVFDGVGVTATAIAKSGVALGKYSAKAAKVGKAAGYANDAFGIHGGMILSSRLARLTAHTAGHGIGFAGRNIKFLEKFSDALIAKGITSETSLKIKFLRESAGGKYNPSFVEGLVDIFGLWKMPAGRSKIGIPSSVKQSPDEYYSKLLKETEKLNETWTTRYVDHVKKAGAYQASEAQKNVVNNFFEEVMDNLSASILRDPLKADLVKSFGQSRFWDEIVSEDSFKVWKSNSASKNVNKADDSLPQDVAITTTYNDKEIYIPVQVIPEVHRQKVIDWLNSNPTKLSDDMKAFIDENIEIWTFMTKIQVIDKYKGLDYDSLMKIMSISDNLMGQPKVLDNLGITVKQGSEKALQRIAVRAIDKIEKSADAIGKSRNIPGYNSRYSSTTWKYLSPEEIEPLIVKFSDNFKKKMAYTTVDNKFIQNSKNIKQVYTDTQKSLAIMKQRIKEIKSVMPNSWKTGIVDNILVTSDEQSEAFFNSLDIIDNKIKYSKNPINTGNKNLDNLYQGISITWYNSVHPALIKKIRGEDMSDYVNLMDIILNDKGNMSKILNFTKQLDESLSSIESAEQACIKNLETLEKMESALDGGDWGKVGVNIESDLIKKNRKIWDNLDVNEQRGIDVSDFSRTYKLSYEKELSKKSVVASFLEKYTKIDVLGGDGADTLSLEQMLYIMNGDPDELKDILKLSDSSLADLQNTIKLALDDLYDLCAGADVKIDQKFGYGRELVESDITGGRAAVMASDNVEDGNKIEATSDIFGGGSDRDWSKLESSIRNRISKKVDDDLRVDYTGDQDYTVINLHKERSVDNQVLRDQNGDVIQQVSLIVKGDKEFVGPLQRYAKYAKKIENGDSQIWVDEAHVPGIFQGLKNAGYDDVSKWITPENLPSEDKLRIFTELQLDALRRETNISDNLSDAELSAFNKNADIKDPNYQGETIDKEEFLDDIADAMSENSYSASQLEEAVNNIESQLLKDNLYSNESALFLKGDLVGSIDQMRLTNEIIEMVEVGYWGPQFPMKVTAEQKERFAWTLRKKLKDAESLPKSGEMRDHFIDELVDTINKSFEDIGLLGRRITEPKLTEEMFDVIFGVNADQRPNYEQMMQQLRNYFNKRLMVNIDDPKYSKHFTKNSDLWKAMGIQDIENITFPGQIPEGAMDNISDMVDDMRKNGAFDDIAESLGLSDETDDLYINSWNPDNDIEEGDVLDILNQIFRRDINDMTQEVEEGASVLDEGELDRWLDGYFGGLNSPKGKPITPHDEDFIKNRLRSNLLQSADHIRTDVVEQEVERRLMKILELNMPDEVVAPLPGYADLTRAEQTEIISQLRESISDGLVPKLTKSQFDVVLSDLEKGLKAFEMPDFNSPKWADFTNKTNKDIVDDLIDSFKVKGFFKSMNDIKDDWIETLPVLNKICSKHGLAQTRATHQYLLDVLETIMKKDPEIFNRTPEYDEYYDFISKYAKKRNKPAKLIEDISKVSAGNIEDLIQTNLVDDYIHYLNLIQNKNALNKLPKFYRRVTKKSGPSRRPTPVGEVDTPTSGNTEYNYSKGTPELEQGNALEIMSDYAYAVGKPHGDFAHSYKGFLAFANHWIDSQAHKIVHSLRDEFVSSLNQGSNVKLTNAKLVKVGESLPIGKNPTKQMVMEGFDYVRIDPKNSQKQAYYRIEYQWDDLENSKASLLPGIEASDGFTNINGVASASGTTADSRLVGFENIVRPKDTEEDFLFIKVQEMITQKTGMGEPFGANFNNKIEKSITPERGSVSPFALWMKEASPVLDRKARLTGKDFKTELLDKLNEIKSNASSGDFVDMVVPTRTAIKDSLNRVDALRNRLNGSQEDFNFESLFDYSNHGLSFGSRNHYFSVMEVLKELHRIEKLPDDELFLNLSKLAEKIHKGWANGGKFGQNATMDLGHLGKVQRRYRSNTTDFENAGLLLGFLNNESTSPIRHFIETRFGELSEVMTATKITSDEMLERRDQFIGFLKQLGLHKKIEINGQNIDLTKVPMPTSPDGEWQQFNTNITYILNYRKTQLESTSVSDVTKQKILDDLPFGDHPRVELEDYIVGDKVAFVPKTKTKEKIVWTSLNPDDGKLNIKTTIEELNFSEWTNYFKKNRAVKEALKNPEENFNKNLDFGTQAVDLPTLSNVLANYPELFRKWFKTGRNLREFESLFVFRNGDDVATMDFIPGLEALAPVRVSVPGMNTVRGKNGAVIVPSQAPIGPDGGIGQVKIEGWSTSSARGDTSSSFLGSFVDSNTNALDAVTNLEFLKIMGSVKFSEALLRQLPSTTLDTTLNPLVALGMSFVAKTGMLTRVGRQMQKRSRGRKLEADATEAGEKSGSITSYDQMSANWKWNTSIKAGPGVLFNGISSWVNAHSHAAKAVAKRINGSKIQNQNSDDTFQLLASWNQTISEEVNSNGVPQSMMCPMFIWEDFKTLHGAWTVGIQTVPWQIGHVGYSIGVPVKSALEWMASNTSGPVDPFSPSFIRSGSWHGAINRSIRNIQINAGTPNLELDVSYAIKTGEMGVPLHGVLAGSQEISDAFADTLVGICWSQKGQAQRGWGYSDKGKTKYDDDLHSQDVCYACYPAHFPEAFCGKEDWPCPKLAVDNGGINRYSTTNTERYYHKPAKATPGSRGRSVNYIPQPIGGIDFNFTPNLTSPPRPTKRPKRKKRN